LEGPVRVFDPTKNEFLLASFSSRGPTPDGRIKPDILAPGSYVTSAKSDGRLNSFQCSKGLSFVCLSVLTGWLAVPLSPLLSLSVSNSFVCFAYVYPLFFFLSLICFVFSSAHSLFLSLSLSLFADNSLLAMEGTSMATPITAGAAALVRQYFMDGYYPSGAASMVRCAVL
jgi:subtilisin family serine protease